MRKRQHELGSLTASSGDLLAAVSSSLPALAILAILAAGAQLIATRQRNNAAPT